MHGAALPLCDSFLSSKEHRLILSLYLYFFSKCEEVGVRLRLWELESRLLPETAAWQSEEAQHCQEHPEGEQREDIQEGVHAQEEAKDHQLGGGEKNVTQQHLQVKQTADKLRTLKLHNHQRDRSYLYIKSASQTKHVPSPFE